MKNSFDTTRFWMATIDDLRTNLKKYALMIGTCLGVIGLIILMNLTMINTYGNLKITVSHNHIIPITDPMIKVEFFLFWCGLIIMSAVCGSAIFKPLSTKLGRINDLMLPATQTEKFLARWLILCPLFIIAYFIGFQMLDLLRVVLAWMLHPDWSEYIRPVGLKILSLDKETHTIFLWQLWVIAINATYALGGSIWPKRGVLITTLVGFAISMSLTIYFSVLSAFTIANANLPLFLRNHIDPLMEWPLPLLTVYTPMIIYILVTLYVANLRYKETDII